MVMTGRRRVGKTQVLSRPLKHLGHDSFYLFVGRKQPTFLHEVYRHMGVDRFPEAGPAGYARIGDLTHTLVQLSSLRPILIALD